MEAGKQIKHTSMSQKKRRGQARKTEQPAVIVEPESIVEAAEGICHSLHRRILLAARERNDRERERLENEYLEAVSRLRIYSR